MKNVGRIQRGASALAVALGLLFVHGLVNCGSSLPSGGNSAGHGGTGGGGSGGGPAGTTGGDGGRGGSACLPGDCRCNTMYCWETAGAPPGGSGGSGGSGGGGTSGSAGGGGSGGSAGSGASWAPPSCLRDLFAACPIDGDCHTRVTDAGFAGYCLASGAAAEPTEGHSCGPQVDGGISNDEVSVYKPDGSLCFKFEARWHYSCEFASWTWTNGAGEIIATGQGSWGQGTYASAQCTTGGEAISCGIGSCPAVTTLTGPLGPFGPTSCSAGTCP